ncbi:MAG: VIT and VWA domain-containing protein [Candidatus Sedimenticola sp. (ex Thyasira tokunagai)]
MKPRKSPFRLGLMLLLSIFTTWFSLADAAGLLTPADKSLPELEIKQHEVEVTIEDGYAITRVEQTFHNPHSRDLEAIYSFPVPEHGAVAEFTLWIDGKPVSGEVLEKKEARKVYEEEKAAGREAGITEKDSYKTFDVSVHPVRAGQETKIRLVYLQPAHIDSGIGRYVYPLEEGGVDEAKLSFWTANEKVRERFSFKLKVKSAWPVDALRAPSHPQAAISHKSDGEWDMVIDSGTQSTSNTREETPNTSPSTATSGQPVYTLDKDIAVYWRQADNLPGAVELIAHKPADAKKGTFMMVVTPGDDLQPITEGGDWTFVLDISGSMNGKYAALAEGVEKALSAMRSNDRFRIVLFNNRAHEMTNGYVTASAENVARYIEKVAKVQPGNGTNLYSGLKLGLKGIDADRTSAIMLVTDGVANVGETEQRKFLELIDKRDIRLFTFIMGNSNNRPMLEAITKASNGFYISVSNSDDIVGQILLAKSKVTHQALHDVEVDIKGIKVAEMTPKRIGSLYRGQQLVILGHYWGEGEADVTLSGKISGSKTAYKTRFAFPKNSSENPELERLWAYATIEHLTNEMNDFGEKADLKQAVTDLGVEYGLVTDYTSMVVLRDEVFQQRGIERRNKKRLAVEESARQQRATRPAQNRRVDSAQPMYSSNRATTRGSSGGGAIDPLGLIILAGIPALLIFRRKGSEG